MNSFLVICFVSESIYILLFDIWLDNDEYLKIKSGTWWVTSICGRPY